ncbi:MAG: hypothetical protein HC895_26585, partial [Leptolyngbyaceae cyanobacterium SM1_3_5]|nr:hypothetical protein [Leptolyngbyaceae cyanobacterium SM1_3_5]
AIARTVRDAAVLLDAMAGHTLGDPYWLPDPKSSFLSAADQAPRSLRIAYATEIQPIGAFDPICTQAIEETVQLLEQMGHSVESIALDFSDLMEPLIAVWQAGVDVGVPANFSRSAESTAEKAIAPSRNVPQSRNADAGLRPQNRHKA